jgi:serine/threonine protein kinase
VYDYFLANGTAYIVMEYCESGSLADKIYDQETRKEIVIEDILAPIVYGLKQVHEHDILHLDIKPENILFRKDGTPLLIDFGAARKAIGDKSRHIKAIYTPGFAPLEQFSTDSKIGPGTDIYALAAVAYTFIKGEKPPAATDRIINDRIDKMSLHGDSSFYRSLDKALSLHLDDRPPTLGSWLATWKPTNTQIQDSSINTEINIDDLRS